jgi:hypothetical protein
MDPAQEKQVKRFTSTMWAVLRYTANRGPMAKIGGRWLRPARVLEARGFVVVCQCTGGCYSARLTAVGAEALALSAREDARRIARQCALARL